MLNSWRVSSANILWRVLDNTEKHLKYELSSSNIADSAAINAEKHLDNVVANAENTFNVIVSNVFFFSASWCVVTTKNY